MIKKLQLKNFTAFKELDLALSPGINIFIGENSTGKTHIMKALYAACSTSEKETFQQRLYNIFMPAGQDNQIAQLVTKLRATARGTASISVEGVKKDSLLEMDFTSQGRVALKNNAHICDRKKATYIPVKDMLVLGGSFVVLAEAYKIPGLESIYIEIIKKAQHPIPRGKRAVNRAQLMALIEETVSGNVYESSGNFFYKSNQGDLEFSLLAEGYRKLGLLWLLIQNESLTKGSVLFWDEPEANLNPKLTKTVVDILIALQRMGVQIFIATHDYLFLKEFELAAKKQDKIAYHSLYKDDNRDVKCSSVTDFYRIEHNPIAEAYDSLLDRELLK